MLCVKIKIVVVKVKITVKEAGVLCVEIKIVVVKVKTTVKVQNFIESFCILYLPYY